MSSAIRGAELLKLNPYGVTFRYDDQDIELLTLDDPTRIVRAVRAWADEHVNATSAA